MILEQIKKKSLRLSDGRVYPTVTGSLVTVNPGFTLSKLSADSYEEGSVRNTPHNLMKYSETPL